MNDPTPDVMRRRLLGTGGAALALAAAPGGAHAATTGTITRSRFGIPADTALPAADTTFVLPFSTVSFRNAKDCTLRADNTVLINRSGMYRVCLSCDWPGQYGVDIDLRTYGIRLVKAGGQSAAFRAAPDVLTPVPDSDTHLATTDMPGSDPPQMVRWQGTWAPGAIALGGMASLDITMPTAGIVAAGDLVFASLTSIADGVIGVAATTALIVTGKVIGPNLVRITVLNPNVAAGVTVPSGTLQVVAMSAVNTRGESADAWTVLQSTTEPLDAGDVVYAIFRSRTPGDFLQASDSSFLQVERWA